MLDFCVKGKAMSFRVPVVAAGLIFEAAFGCTAPSAANKLDDRRRPSIPPIKEDDLFMRLLKEGIKAEQSLGLSQECKLTLH